MLRGSPPRPSPRASAVSHGFVSPPCRSSTWPRRCRIPTRRKDRSRSRSRWPAAYAVALFVWVHLKPVGQRFALSATGVDVGVITALAVLSGGAYSEARLAYFLIP